MAVGQPLRSDPFIWYMRLIQLLVTLIVLGITGQTASFWHSWSCNTPSNVAFNIACAALTLPALIYLLASSGKTTSTHLLPWNQWGQLGLDAFLFVLWLAATSDSPYNCTNLCNACQPLDVGYGYYAWAGSVQCACAEAGDFVRRNIAKKALEGRATAGGSAAKVVLKSSRIAVKQGFDAVMIFLFLITLITTSVRIYNARKAGSAQGNNGSVSEVTDYNQATMMAEDVHKPLTSVLEQQTY